MVTTAPVRNILLATDFSELSLAAAHVAAEQAQQINACIHVLHVRVPGEDNPAPLLAAVAADLERAVASVTAVTAGDAAQSIVDYARDHDITMIVVGTHGRTGMSRMLLGSVTERVVRTAPCPVLVVPSASASRVATASPSLNRCLVCGADAADLICKPCRAQIRGEALERKREHAARL